MSYEFIKLSEVEKVSIASEANILIEENGEIKRMPISDLNIEATGGTHYQADWNETDEDHPAFILNKPSTANLGGVINYTSACGTVFIDGIPQSANDIANAWANGAAMRINGRTVVDISYYTSTGSYAVSEVLFHYVYGNSIEESEWFS